MNGMPSLTPVLKRNFWNAFATFAAVVGASALYLRVTPPVYESSARLILDERRVSVSELGQALAANSTAGNASPIATQAELITSERVLKRAVGMLEPRSASEKPLPSVGELSGAIRVKIVPATSILELSYKNPDPKLAAEVLNAVSQAAVQESGESIRQQASSVREFVETRVPQQQANLEQAELAESRFKEANGIVALDAQDTSLVNSLATIEDQGRTLSAQLAESQRKSGLLQGVIGVNNVQTAYLASRAGQDDELKTLRGKLTDLEAQVIDARSRLGDQHPDLLALMQKRDETRSLYTQSLGRIVPGQQGLASGKVAADDLSRALISNYITGEVERSALQDKLNTVTQQQQPLRDRLSTLPAKQRVLSNLMRRREQEAATLKLLQNKLEEARVAEAQLVSNVRIVGLAAVPASPASPKPFLGLMLGSAAGAVLAIGVILIGELLNTKIGSAAEAESQLKLPVLGVLTDRLPALKAGQLERFLNNPAAVEPYRRLLKTLELNSSNPLKSVLITSSVAGEGKSNVAARLAMVAAMLSRRTLLIDADLSHPLQHQFFDVPDQPGLTDAVSENLPLQSVVLPTAIENLNLLPHGQWFNRPAQVLEASAMKTLMTQAMAQYDLVIIDTSPVSRYADAMTLNEYTDGMVLVVRPEFTPKAIALQTTADLQKSGSSVLGTVVTATPDPAGSDRSNPSNTPQLPTKDFSRRNPLGSTV